MIKQTMNISNSFRAPSPVAPWRLVADALENERALDVKYREASTTLPPSGPVPNFKVMKQLSIEAQLGWLYPFVIALAPIAIIFAAPWQWLLLLIGAAGGKRRELPEQACRVFATTEGNRAIIDAALDNDPQIARLPRYQIRFDPRTFGSEIGWSGCASVMHAHLRWLFYALTRPVGVRRDLLLHGHDVLALLGLVRLAGQVGHIFVTDDHYQRWAHVLSHVATDFRIVQHGFLDEKLVLPHEGGIVKCLYLRDSLFLASFMRYYSIVEQQLFSPSANFVQTPFSKNALLLASSFPSIDEEIRLLSAVRASCNLAQIVVKFHPAHRYDTRREQLAALATMVYEGTGNPACRVFVSHGSFMEFDYRRHGVDTVSIARSGSIDAAAEEIRLLFDKTVSTQSGCELRV